jgi:hypothetical protein
MGRRRGVLCGQPVVQVVVQQPQQPGNKLIHNTATDQKCVTCRMERSLGTYPGGSSVFVSDLNSAAVSDTPSSTRRSTHSADEDDELRYHRYCWSDLAVPTRLDRHQVQQAMERIRALRRQADDLLSPSYATDTGALQQNDHVYIQIDN